MEEQILQLQKRVEELEQGTNSNNIENIIRRYGDKVIGIETLDIKSDSDIQVSINIPSFGDYDFLDYPDKMLKVKIKGQVGYIPFYNESRFV